MPRTAGGGQAVRVTCIFRHDRIFRSERTIITNHSTIMAPSTRGRHDGWWAMVGSQQPQAPSDRLAVSTPPGPRTTDRPSGTDCRPASRCRGSSEIEMSSLIPHERGPTRYNEASDHGRPTVRNDPRRPRQRYGPGRGIRSARHTIEPPTARPVAHRAGRSRRTGRPARPLRRTPPRPPGSRTAPANAAAVSARPTAVADTPPNRSMNSRGIPSTSSATEPTGVPPRRGWDDGSRSWRRS